MLARPRPNGLAALTILLRYILEVAESSPDDIQELLHQFLLPEASETVMTAAERLRNEGREEGRKEGIKEGRREGIKEGIEEAQRENLRTLLSLRFGTRPGHVLPRILRAEPAQLQRWFQRGVTAPSLDAVFADEP